MRPLLLVPLFTAACSREPSPSPSPDPTPPVVASTAPSPSAPPSASPPKVVVPSSAPSTEPPPSPPPPTALPKLTPFLKLVTGPVPPSAWVHRPSEDIDRAPPGFDPKAAKPESLTKLSDGGALLVFGHHGPSDAQWMLAVQRDGKIVATYSMVREYTVEPKAGLLALRYTKVVDGKARFATDIVDLKTLALSPLPNLTCVDRLTFRGDSTLFATGFSVDKEMNAHAEICVFDSVGKVLVRLDAGTHILHAASSHFIRMPTGVLPAQPSVVWAMREYEGYGDFDLTLIDTAPPHTVKVARLPTPAGNGGALASVELDLEKLSLESTEVRYRGKNSQGWYWQWTTRPLRSLVEGDAGL